VSIRSPSVRPSVCLSICMSHTNISETKRDRAILTIKRVQEIGVPDSKSAIRRATESTILPFLPPERRAAIVVATWLSVCLCVCHVDVLCPND